MNEKQVTIITVVVLAVILLVGGGAGYYFYFVALAELEQERDNLAAQVARDRAKALKIPELEENIKQLGAKLEELTPLIPNRDRLEYDKFANLLDSIRRRAGVRVPSASYAEARRSRPVPGRRTSRLPTTMHKVEYTVQVEGSFYQLLRYVNLLEVEKRFIKVQSFTIQPESSSGDAEGSAPVRKMDLKVYTFTYLQKDVPMVSEQDRPKGSSTPPPD